jgi:hypothetical protein
MTFTGYAQNNVGINDDNSSPNASAMLDVHSTSKGLLIPRISLTSTTDVETIPTPATSLLVYNTATNGDVTPGYYYWNGSTNWLRLLDGADIGRNVNIVTKTADATLLKTENMVLASGNTTLTLPTVTNDDDGLEITIKNVGTYTDLITVEPESGKNIDADTSSTLTRWMGMTYIAKGSNWIVKEKVKRWEDLLDVGPSESFVTIAEAVAFLNSHMKGATVVRITGGNSPVTSTITINLPYPVTFQGQSFSTASIIATSGVSGTPLFICQTECYFKMLSFKGYSNASGNDAIRLTGSGKYCEIKDCDFDTFNKGLLSASNNDMWIFETDFNNCVGAGIEIAAGTASGGRLRMSETDFISCGVGINLLSGVSETVSITNSGFYNTPSGTDIGIQYTPATFTSYTTMYISHCTWNNQGTYMSGFDFTRSDGRDANVYVINNVGMANQNPHCKVNVSNNATTTVISSAGIYYKANWTNATSSSTCKWTLNNNRITYQPTNKGDAWAIISGNISVNNANRVITIALFKNGLVSDRYGETDLRITVGNQPFQFSTVVYVPNLGANDYLELGVTSANNNDIVTFQDIQWFTNTQ